MAIARPSYALRLSTHGVTGAGGGKKKYPLNTSQKKSNFENQNDNLRELTKYKKRIGNYQILILDEWLNYKLTEKDARNLYELFEQRSGNNSTIFVGQYPVDEWHNRLGGGTQADSIMDRIIHNAYEIPTNETNLRKLYDLKKLKRLVDEIET